MVTMTQTVVPLLIIITSRVVLATDVTSPDVQVLKTLTFYDQPERRIPLDKEQKTTNVTISLLVAALYLNLNKMQAEVDFFLRKRWEDTRLNYTSLRSTNETSDDESWEEPYRVLRHDWDEFIWKPDIFIPNAVSTERFETPVHTVSGVLYANGTMISDTRMRAVVNCPVDTYKFLHDSQFCRVRFESMSYSTDQLRLVWHRPDPVNFDDRIKQAKTTTTLSDSDLQDCTTRRFYREHSCLQVTLTLQRTNNIYVTQVYFPSMLTVILSWLTFWIDRDAILARVSLGSLCVVTIMTHATGLLSRLPDQAGIKAIDVWELACVTLIFCAMLEFATMHAMLRRQQAIKAARKFVEEFNDHRQDKEIVVGDVMTNMVRESDLPGADNTHHLVNETRKQARRLIRPIWWQIHPEKIDKLARRLFPLTFLLFNIVYWSVYTSN